MVQQSLQHDRDATAAEQQAQINNNADNNNDANNANNNIPIAVNNVVNNNDNNDNIIQQPHFANRDNNDQQLCHTDSLDDKFHTLVHNMELDKADTARVEQAESLLDLHDDDKWQL